MTSPRPRASDRVLAKDAGDEIMFYDEEGDRVHILNAAARTVYLLCDGTRTEQEIVAEFKTTWNLDEETAARDATTALRDLEKLELILPA